MSHTNVQIGHYGTVVVGVGVGVNGTTVIEDGDPVFQQFPPLCAYPKGEFKSLGSPFPFNLCTDSAECGMVRMEALDLAPGMNFNGTYLANNAEQCMDHCKAQPGCEGVVYRPDNIDP